MTASLALGTALLAGFFGSTHCIGMCGAIVTMLETPVTDNAPARAWLRRGLYNLGRLGFYVLLGGIAGISGALLLEITGLASGLRVLRLLAALCVIAIGLDLLLTWRLTRFLESAGTGLWKTMSRFAALVLPAHSPGRALAAGFIWGALPCGLVYSAVAVAATSGSVQQGAAIMFAFWLGTLPALLAVGASATRLRQWRGKPALRRSAGLLMVLLGIAAIVMLVPLTAAHLHTAQGMSN